METEQKGRARLEKMVATPTAQVGPGNKDKTRANNGMDLICVSLGLIWIEIGVYKKNSRSELAHPLMGTIFLVYIMLATLRE